jgi:hypothetical protein
MIERTDANCMQTFTGKAFWPLNPKIEDIDIIDIAWSLSMQCRFTGHTRKFYSVAEHCIHCSFLVDYGDALTALLHDASEAYITDIARPVKIHLSEYKEYEAELERAIAKRFGTIFPIPAHVKVVDNRMLITERDELLGVPPMDWSSDLLDVQTAAIKIQCWSPEQAYVRFLQRFEELTTKESW